MIPTGIFLLIVWLIAFAVDVTLGGWIHLLATIGAVLLIVGALRGKKREDVIRESFRGR